MPSYFMMNDSVVSITSFIMHDAASSNPTLSGINGHYVETIYLGDEPMAAPFTHCRARHHLFSGKTIIQYRLGVCCQDLLVVLGSQDLGTLNNLRTGSTVSRCCRN